MENKFKDIKVDDVILIPVTSRSYATGNYTFMIGKRVTALTPTQFKVGERRFRKSDGFEIGSTCFYNAEKYAQSKDQEPQYQLHLKKVNNYLKVTRDLQEIRIPEFCKLSNEDIYAILNRIVDLKYTIVLTK